MDAVQSLYYGLGQVAYTVAASDGQIQSEELEKLETIFNGELRRRNHNVDYAEIIFKLLKKDGTSGDDAYGWAINAIKLGSHHLTPKMKQDFIEVIAEIAEAFPPTTKEEQEVINRFTKDMASI
ncbi:MAG: hypothetical protein ACK4K0_03105 [Flavobacteriales bacterium]